MFHNVYLLYLILLSSLNHKCETVHIVQRDIMRQWYALYVLLCSTVYFDVLRKNIFSYFIQFLHTETARVVEIFVSWETITFFLCYMVNTKEDESPLTHGISKHDINPVCQV